MFIFKAGGSKEIFDKKKIFRTAIKAGASKKFAQEVANKVEGEIREGMTTREILNLVLKFLKKDKPVAEKYSLKKALMELGPAGYFFEKYFAKILEHYGYNTKVGVMLQGKKITQEIDILATKKGESIMVECKYHNSVGNYSNLKVAMYTYARFLDVKKDANSAMLVTNTKCTTSAIKYAEGVNLKIVGWNYPKKGNLQDLIEEKGLYPVTVLFRVKGHIKDKLVEAKISTVKELVEKDLTELKELTKLSEKDLVLLKKDSSELIGN
jgi:predicted RecB family endonuclease